MAPSELPSARSSSSVATLGKRVLAYVVLLGVGLLTIKLVIGAVIGVIVAIGTVALAIALVVAVVWAVRRL